jgi:acetyl-CoA C-acetyltransferase
MGDGATIDAMVGALTDPFDDCHMGITAENVAGRWGISREDQDALAVESHQRAAKATANGVFGEQILPVQVPDRKGTTTVSADGSVTAGNSSGVNDAAAAVVLATADVAKQRGLTPMGRLVAYSHVGVEPKYMGIGPVPAVRALLDRAGLEVADIDVFEVNEAFAAQALAVVRDLELPEDKTNPNGSGISLGHPIGATGAILVVKALHELARIDGRYAVVTMCIGGGQGIAALFERS